MTELTPDSAPGRHDAGGASQGEALATWGLWTMLLVAIAITYSRLDPTQLYHVTGNGVAGGLSRVLVQLNYPVSLVAIGIMLIAADTLPNRWWWALGPAIGLCAVTAWPGVVDEADLDARLVNAAPAIGVGIGVVSTLAAAARTGTAVATGRRYDPVRIAIGIAVIALSLPWVASNLGFFLPEPIFITERPITGDDGVVNPAVHLGHHHGFDGALLAISALLLSRPRLRSDRLRRVATGYVSLMFAYGAVNFAQDVWNEQIAKRGWVDWNIPSAIKPTLSPIWLIIVAITGATVLFLRSEDRDDGDPGIKDRGREEHSTRS